MVRACEIIAQRLAGVLAQEDRSGIFHLGHKFKRILCHNLQMLGSNSIDRVYSVVHIVGDEDVAVIFQGFFENRPSGKLL